MDQLSTPAGEITESPLGSAPLSSVLVAVPVTWHVPPVTTICWLYAVPTTASGRVSVTICSGPAAGSEAARQAITGRVRNAYLKLISNLPATFTSVSHVAQRRLTRGVTR